jgi:predicted amidohydrolase
VYRKIFPWTPKEPWTAGHETAVAVGPKGLVVGGVICESAATGRQVTALPLQISCVNIVVLPVDRFPGLWPPGAAAGSWSWSWSWS